MGEHLPYKQGVGGSSPPCPTIKRKFSAKFSLKKYRFFCWFSYNWIEQPPCKRKVGGSSPSTSTIFD